MLSSTPPAACPAVCLADRGALTVGFAQGGSGNHCIEQMRFPRTVPDAKERPVTNPDHPGRSFTMGSLLVILVVAAAIVFALVMGIHSFG